MKKEKQNKTFILHLQFRQNKSWQGTIKWADSMKTLQFRSALELMRIIASTCRESQEAEPETDCLEVLNGKVSGD